MKIKYNRCSTIQQTGLRFTLDENHYDLTLLDKVSGSIPFKERPMGKEIVRLVESGELTELVVEDWSRLGRSTGDCISVAEWLDNHSVNIIVRNIGLESRKLAGHCMPLIFLFIGDCYLFI
jgi:DNA invertase Pin-like site-specific DNA recombinase